MDGKHPKIAFVAGPVLAHENKSTVGGEMQKSTSIGFLVR
jgi:hypothetical protein